MVGCCFDDYRETSRSFYLIFFPVPPFCVFVARFFSNLPGLWPYGVFPHYFLTFVRLQSRYCPATYCCFFVLLPLPPALVFFVFPLNFHTFSPIVCSSSFAEVPPARSAPRSAALVPSFGFLRHSHPPQRDFAPPPHMLIRRSRKRKQEKTYPACPNAAIDHQSIPRREYMSAWKHVPTTHPLFWKEAEMSGRASPSVCVPSLRIQGAGRNKRGGKKGK